MAMQIRPFATVRRHTDGAAPIVLVPISTKLPPAESVEVRIGNGFRTKGEISNTLRDLAREIDGAALDHEEQP